MLRSSSLLLFLVTASSQILVAQGVTVRATALTELKAKANAVTQTIAANTDITTGATLSVADNIGTAASAAMTFSLDHGPLASTIELAEGGSGAVSFDFTMPGGLASVGQHRIQIVYTSPRPVQARLTARYCTAWGNSTTSSYDASLEVVGQTTITPSTNDGLCFFGYPHTQTLDVTIDAGGLTLNFDTHGRCQGAVRGGPGSFQGRWEVTLTPDQDFPCAPTVYGVDCGGAALGASSDFGVPGTHLLTLTDPGTMAVAVIVFGTQRQSIPFPPNCTLLNNLVLGFGVPLNQGVATLRFTPPSIPGLVFQVQGAAGLANLNLHLSNGIEFVCP